MLLIIYWLSCVFTAVRGLSPAAESGAVLQLRWAVRGLLLWQTSVPLAQSSGHMGPAAPRQGGQTHGPCTGRQTLSHWTPREAPLGAFHKGSEERPVMVPQG